MTPAELWLEFEVWDLLHPPKPVVTKTPASVRTKPGKQSRKWPSLAEQQAGFEDISRIFQIPIVERPH